MSKERINIDRVKKLVLIALVSDDELMETLVLKGGNALLMAYNLSLRASWDLDFSISEDFKDVEAVKKQMQDSIVQTFKNAGLFVFDFSFLPKPRIANDATKDFWGGYLVHFKFIEFEKVKELGGENNMDSVRRNAIPVSPDNSPKIVIEISKYEFVADKRDFELDGYTLYVYAPRLLVFEKVRAICQQLPEYANIIPSFSPRPRPRDFYDIYNLLINFEIELNNPESKHIMRSVFDAKKVPCDFLKRIRMNREMHKQSFPSLVDTVSLEEKQHLKDFDFYFDYVVEKFENFLETF